MIDQELEAAMDEVGRDRVFMRAWSYGYSTENCPEKGVWWSIVREFQVYSVKRRRKAEK